MIESDKFNENWEREYYAISINQLNIYSKL